MLTAILGRSILKVSKGQIRLVFFVFGCVGLLQLLSYIPEYASAHLPSPALPKPKNPSSGIGSCFTAPTSINTTIVTFLKDNVKNSVVPGM